ncbi:alpha/beta hydrolase [Phenylobacterium sp.]|uniref:alpha/beta fold hydrolase n=1 Tax=Phenylobacterium sp. TaxID=1871053 RepID=UPI002ED8EA99
MWAKIALIGLGAVAMLVAGLAAYRAVRQAQAAERQALKGPNAIDEAGFVRIGGIDQWVSIRGEDRRNPVLVVLHGGPGAAFQVITYEAMRPWERDFTIVQWDQRGAGRTFGRNGAKGSGELSIDRMADDGVEVVRHALARTGQEKAIVLGASWGSILGVQIARRSPELLHAYIGAGQVVDMQANEAVGYDGLMARLKVRGEIKAADKLAAIGPPPYASLSVLLKARQILMAHPPASERGLYRRALIAGLSAPKTRLADLRDWFAAQSFSIGRLYGPMMAYSDCTPAPQMPVPVVIVQGDEDIQTPTSLARAYFDSLQAPSKAFVIIPGGGHSAVFAMPDEFRKVLLKDVRPLATS